MHGYIDISTQLKTSPYTAPYDCFVRMSNRTTNGVRPYINYLINGKDFNCTGYTSNADSTINDIVGLRKGDILKLNSSYAYEQTGTFTAHIL